MTNTFWIDIYGHAKPEAQFLKGPAYNTDSATPGIGTERDPVKHRAIRKALSPAFGTGALKTQAQVALQYVNQFLDQIRKHEAAGESMDMGKVS